MPILKQISVHTTPNKNIEYILNGDKNDEMKYATGLNCTADAKCATDELRQTFEHYAGEPFLKYELSGKKKERVRIHHFIQSFAPDENVTAEQAHKIGIEWAKKVFGDDWQIVVSTHIDKNHIHNHFAVCPYSLDGKHYVSNKQTLEYARKISDGIAIAHGLTIIADAQYRANHKYTEWLARQKGNSWKQKLCDDIDKLILDNDVTDIEGLVDKLNEMGYTVNRKKYISIKPPNSKRAIRSFRLGDGYSLEDLQYRILHKNQEMSISAIYKKYGCEMQIEYALCLRQMQIALFHHKQRNSENSYYRLRKNTELLRFLRENDIRSESELREYADNAAKAVSDKKAEIRLLRREIEMKENAIVDSRMYFELMAKDELTAAERRELKQLEYVEMYITEEKHIPEMRANVRKLQEHLSDEQAELEKLEANKKEIGSLYLTYTNQMSNGYAEIAARLKKEQEEAKLLLEREQQQAEEAEKREREGDNRKDSHNHR